ncbi:MAG TPA: MbnH family di-heme enzyme [Polyangiaceae bacterium]|jgi:cytochrome c peroxidase|nr:MbnH family di-heme enzyme [Polyangiaceae bacterium]
MRKSGFSNERLFVLVGAAMLACGPSRSAGITPDGGVKSAGGNAGSGIAGSAGTGIAGSAIGSGGQPGTGGSVTNGSGGLDAIDATVGSGGNNGMGGSTPAPGMDAGYPEIDDAGQFVPTGPFQWNLPHGFPVPLVPVDNPMTYAKVKLGRFLFYDTRLSFNGTESCATCHDPAQAFTDGRAHGLGSTGELHPRGPMSLANVAYAATLTWENPDMKELEPQAKVPLFGDHPVELGLGMHEDDVVERLSGVPAYESMFARAFPADASPITVDNVTRALSSFERTLLSGGSRYDRDVIDGDFTALTASEARGLALFNDDRFSCFQCHAGTSFTRGTVAQGMSAPSEVFENTGLYNVDGKGAYPAATQGVIDFTHQPADMGKFKAPTLRNIAVTAPYMHDGSIATLDEVLDHYAAGGRTIATGPNAGDGSKNPFKSGFVHGFTATADERADLIAFLNSLTDDDFLKDPRFSDPWPAYKAAN